MYVENLAETADARSVVKPLGAAVEYWSSIVKTPYAGKSLIQKYEIIYQYVKSYFIFGSSSLLAW